MEGKYLIVNVGSTSKRYAVYFRNKAVFNIHFKTNSGLPKISDILKKNNVIKNEGEITKIGIRVVSPGIYFQRTRIIDKTYLKMLEQSVAMAPLHIKPTFEEIKKLQKQFPNVKIIGVSDSSFHSTMPEIARLYAIPLSDSKKFQIYRYGYHGISISSVISQIKSKYKKIPSKIIVCHLGGGSSITAVKNGKSVETSMGFTPLEGLPMSTRSGNIDFNAGLYILKSKKITRIEGYLNEKSGFLGISEISDSMDKLIKLSKSGNKKAELAVDKFVYEIEKYIGAYTAVLGGVDLLVFTGAIGENSHFIRKLIIKKLKFLGIEGLKILVLHTNEEEEIFKEIIKF